MPLPFVKRTKILYTMLALLLGVAMLPLLISDWVLININKEALETLEKKYLGRTADKLAGQIRDQVRNYQEQLQKIADAMKISGQLAAENVDPFVYMGQTGIIDDYMTSDPNLLALRVINSGQVGSVVEPKNLEPAIQDEFKRAFQAAMTGKPYIGEFFYLAGLNDSGLVLARPVKGEDGTVIGVVEALISLANIAADLQSESKGDVVAFIVDVKGKTLLHSEPMMNLQRPDVADNELVAEFIKFNNISVTRPYTVKEAGVEKRVLGTITPVVLPNWAVVVQKDEAKAFASVHDMVVTTVQWSLTALILAIVVAVVAARRMSKPIHELNEKSRQIAAGNFEQRVEVNARNEIGDLAETFNVMSQEIQKNMEGLRRAAHENNQLFVNSVRTLSAAIDAKDPYTRGHSERVTRYSVAIAKHMGLDAEEVRRVRLAALLHDVGKIGIDDRILRKPAVLTEEEFEIMKTHPSKGASIMSPIPQLKDVIPGMKHHHEKWEGGGYPDGLRGEQIPVIARVISVADTFDAMTTNRPYQKAMDPKFSIEKIKGFAGTRFEPRVVEAFVKAFNAGDITLEEVAKGAA